MADTNDDQFTMNNPDDTNPMHDLKQDEHLAHDGPTPFSLPQDVQNRLNGTEQQFDADEDLHELYDAGPEAATGTNFPGQTADEEGAEPPETEE